jgi:hypothetical protein
MRVLRSECSGENAWEGFKAGDERGPSPVRSLWSMWWERTPAAGRRPVASLLGRRSTVVGLLALAPKPGACAHRCWSWGR